MISSDRNIPSPHLIVVPLFAICAAARYYGAVGLVLLSAAGEHRRRQRRNRTMIQHKIADRQEWLAARQRLLLKEKQFTRLRDELAAERRALPWVKIDKPYVFETARGTATLAELFGRHSQLIIKHFMFGPGWSEGCVGCSFELDHLDGIVVHLAQRDVGFVVVSRAPLVEIDAFKARMGWRVDWASSCGSDFNYDFNVSFTPEEIERGEACYNYEMRKVGIDELSGRSVFYKDETGAVYHTYSSFGRGGEDLLGTYRLLDIVPNGRNENGGNLSHWVRHHDRYDAAGRVAPTGRWVPEAE
jgi:predicted dithiol-disulfide oxidoreductase (DUF899 family)